MILNIPTLPTFLITIESATERHEKLKKIFNQYMFNDITHINGEILDKTNLSFIEIQKQKSALVARAHIEALKKVKPPFLILEDDIGITETFKPTVEVPEDADCLYLGSSIWGMVNGASTGGGTRGTKINQSICKVNNMLGIHAILYITEKYVEKTIANLQQCINGNQYCDECIANDMLNNNVYCVSYPYFYQNDGHNEMVTGVPMGLYLR